jgi:hypothetical protein
MSMTVKEDQDAPDTGKEEQDDSVREPEPAFDPKSPTPHTTTVPRIKPT